MGLETAILVGTIAAAAGAGVQVDQARRQRKEARAEMGRQAETARRAEVAQKSKEEIMAEQARQRQNRERQRAMMSARAGGRQSTILGGASDVGNAGNQAQAGAGKTLLGV